VNPIQEKMVQSLEKLKAESAWRELRQDAPVSFSHNDYLGLSRHPRLKEAAQAALPDFSAGSRGSRLLGGNLSQHEAAEAALAEFFGAPAALLFSSGYLANLAAITSLAPFVEGIESDELNHASLIDGIRLSGRPKNIYPHRKPVARSGDGPRLWVSESLFSMDGDLLDWSALKGAMAKSDWALIDEAHAAGIFKEEGTGLTGNDRDMSRTVVTITLGKAFGVGGAVLLGPKSFKDWVINSGRSFIYTTAPPPWLAALLLESVNVLREEGTTLRERLWKRTEWVRSELYRNLPEGVLVDAKGVWERRSPVLALRVAGNDNALRISQNMREFGIEVRAIRYPTVARGAERLRLSLNLCATDSETEGLVEKLVESWTAFS